MTTARNGTAKGVRPRRDVLASLREASMEISKPVLPAEIMALILDYLSPVDLIRVARASKLMREMAYDDTRWVKKLKLMGCWSEVEARKHVEQIHGTIVNIRSVEKEEALAEPNCAPALDKTPEAHSASDLEGAPSDGFDEIAVSNQSMASAAAELDQDEALMVMKQVRSIRGEARQEYGKVHAALALYYINIVDRGAVPDNLVFRQYSDPLHQAQILSQLQAFSHCDTTEGWQKRVAEIDRAVSLFETAAVKEFQHGYETDDVDGSMRKYARVLFALNGGRAAIDYFVGQNHILTRKSHFGRPADCIDEATGQVKLRHTQAFFTRLGVAFNEEISIINRAFPSFADISSHFLQSVANVVLYPFLTSVFDTLYERRKESYLTAVSGTFAQCRNFAQSLLPLSNSEDNFEAVHDTLVAKIYEPHIDLYLSEELNFFRTQSETTVIEFDRQLTEQAASTESFLMSNVNRQADKRDFLSSFKQVIMMPVTILPSFSSSKSGDDRSGASTPAPTLSGEFSTVAKSANRSSPLASRPSMALTEAPTTELAAKAAIMKSKLEGISSLFSIEIALSLIHLAKSSLERAAQFGIIDGQSGAAAEQQCKAIFVSLLRILGHRHVIVGFDKAVDHLSNYRPREQNERDKSGVEPLITFLELVNVGDLILQMMDVFYEQELIGSNLMDRNDFLDPAMKEKKKFEQMLDERVAAGLNKGIDVLMDEVDYILATRQRATDFNPDISNDPQRMKMDVGVSKVAVGVVDLVSTHTQMLVGSTDKSVLDVFNQEVGLRLFSALCKHLKRQRVSVEGSLKLISDMNHYFRFIQSLKNQDLLVYFKALRELAQIYLVDASDAKELAALIADPDRYHGIWRVEEVYEFAERRADWYQVKRDVERAMYGIGCLMM